MRYLSAALVCTFVALAAATFLFPGAVSSAGRFGLVCLLVALPNVALYAVPAYVLFKLFPRLRFVGALVVSAALLNGLGLIYNTYRDHEAAVLTSSNHSRAAHNQNGAFLLALRDRLGSRSDVGGECDDLCLRMLVLKYVDAYAVVSVPNSDALKAMAQSEIPAVALRTMSPCPGMRYAGNLYDAGVAYISNADERTIMSVNPQFRMKRMEQEGQCLTKVMLPVNRFSTVIYVERQDNDPFGWWHDWLLRKASTRTIEVLQRDATDGGALKSTFRQVDVFTDRLALPVVVQPSGMLILDLRQALDRLHIRDFWDSTPTNNSRLLRRTVDYTDFPYVYTVIQQQLHLPLALAKITPSAAKPLQTKLPVNPSRAYAVLHAQPFDKKTNFSAEEIQQYMDGFRAVPDSMSMPEMEVQLLLRAQPQSETIILKALLNTMREEPVSGQPYGGQDPLLMRLARAIGQFSDQSIHEAASSFAAFKMTPRQIGSMPDLAAAFGILGPYYKPLLLDILNGYSQRNLSSEAAEYHEYFQYHSAMLGFCRLGTGASDVLPILRRLAETNMLYLQRTRGGIATLITLRRLGASLEDYWPYFAKAGWKRDDFDVFANVGYDDNDCRDWSSGGFFFVWIFQKHPQLKNHWPFQTIRENRSF